MFRWLKYFKRASSQMQLNNDRKSVKCISLRTHSSKCFITGTEFEILYTEVKKCICM